MERTELNEALMKLRAIIAERGITASELAKGSGVSFRTAQILMDGEREYFVASTLHKICSYLGISYSDLLK